MAAAPRLSARAGKSAAAPECVPSRVTDNRVTGLLCEDGSQLTADAYVSAVTHDALLGMLPAELIDRHACFANLRNLRTSPITGIHLWFDRPVMYEPYLALLDHTVQWIFNKTRLSENPDAECPRRMRNNICN